MTHLLAALQPLVSRVRTDVTARRQGTRIIWTREPLTEARLLAHLDGGPYRGVCPMKPGETTTSTALLDLDSHKGATDWETMQKTALKIIDTLEKSGLLPTAFRSTGGHGIHLVLLWQTPQDSYSVRETMRRILTTCGFRTGTGGLGKGEIEIFPKQDQVRPGGWGNQFILPLAGESAFLEPALGLDPVPTESLKNIPWRFSTNVYFFQRAPRSAELKVAAENFRDLDGREIVETQRVILPKISTLLKKVDPDCSYEDWLRVGQILHHETEGGHDGLDLWDQWSYGALRDGHEDSLDDSHNDDQDDGFAPPVNYAGRELIESKWGSFHGIESRGEGGVVTLASLEYMVRGTITPEEIAEAFEDLGPAEADKSEDPVENNTDDGKPPRFGIIHCSDFAARPPPLWIIEDLLPHADFAVIFGESGAGKSFLALDMAMAVARGVAWLGKKVRQGRIVYICAEGAGGFRTRLQAWSHHHATKLADVPLDIIAGTPNFLKNVDAKLIAKEILKGEEALLVIIDTFAQTTAGGNENSSEDMGKAKEQCQVLGKLTGAMPVIIHHAGKDLERGARGWSGLKGGADVEWEISRPNHDEKGRVLHITKNKDGIDGMKWGFELEDVPVGLTDDGKVVTSCVVSFIENLPKKRTVTRKHGKYKSLVFSAFDSIGQHVVSVEEIVSYVRTHHAWEGEGRDRRRNQVARAINDLAEEGAVEVRDETVRLVV